MVHIYANNLINILKNNSSDIKMLENRIVINCSGVILGHKPGSTITFCNNNSLKCQIELWDEYKNMISSLSIIKFFELKRCDEYCTVLAFDSTKLSKTLNTDGIFVFLNKLGYTKYSSIDDILITLKERYEYSIPHEIGLFLGLPLKDVQGYMGFNDLTLSSIMGWNIYGPADQSIRLYKHFEMCRNNAIHMLSIGINPADILRTFPVSDRIKKHNCDIVF